MQYMPNRPALRPSQMLIEGDKMIANENYTLWLAGLNPEALAVVRRSGFADQLGKDRLWTNTREAIKHYQTRSHVA